MTRSRTFHALSFLGILLFAGCGPSASSMNCAPWAPPEELAARPSPFDSVMLHRDTVLEAKLCYSRPLARGRTIFGGLVPFDTLWRTGANEPTILHLAEPAEIAGLAVDAGEYSIYTVPDSTQWMVVVNASTSQWGLTRDERGPAGNLNLNAYTDDVRAQEVGRAPIGTEQIPFVEQLTAAFAPTGVDSEYRLLFDWERTRIVVPLRFVPGTP